MPNSTTISTAEYRVEIAPHYDLWMRGARFGTVIREYRGKHGNMVAVRMDHPQVRKLVRLPAGDVTPLPAGDVTPLPETPSWGVYDVSARARKVLEARRLHRDPDNS